MLSSAVRTRTPTTWLAVWYAPSGMDDVSAINAERLVIREGRPSLNRQALHRAGLHSRPAGIASFYKDWGAIGGGLGNYLVYGDLPTNGYNDPSSFLIPSAPFLTRTSAGL